MGVYGEGDGYIFIIPTIKSNFCSENTATLKQSFRLKINIAF